MEGTRREVDEKGRVVYFYKPDPFGGELSTEIWAAYDADDHKVYEKTLDYEGSHEWYSWYDGENLIYQKNVEPNYVIEYTTMYVSDKIRVEHEKFISKDETREEMKVYKDELNAEGVSIGKVICSMDITNTKIWSERWIDEIRNGEKNDR